MVARAVWDQGVQSPADLSLSDLAGIGPVTEGLILTGLQSVAGPPEPAF